MPSFFELLAEEQDPAVRVVLGHFVFVYMHPYMDGNGRMGRVPDEPDDGGWQAPVDGDSCSGTAGLYGGAGKGERGRGHWPVCGFHRRSCRETVGRRTAAGGAEGFKVEAIRVT